MNSEAPKDKSVIEEGKGEKAETGDESVSGDMYVLDDSVSVADEEVSNEILAAELNECGLDLLKLGKFNEAIVAFEKAIEKDPGNIYLLNNKAAALESVGRFEEALKLYQEAVKVVVENQQASTSFLQRKMRIGYNRAARIMDQLEERGVISQRDGAKPRQVLLSEFQLRD